jgi:hypothetical protein
MEDERRLKQEIFYKKSIFELVEDIKRKIGSEILATLEDFHRQRVYIGIHGGGLTHPLSKDSDIDLTIIPPEFSPDILKEIVGALYCQYSSNSQMEQKDLDNLIGNYASMIDYISLKIKRNGENTLSLHIEKREFTEGYLNRSYAIELRQKRKSSGISNYLDVCINQVNDGGLVAIPVTVAVAQVPITGTEAVLNFPHTTLSLPWEGTSLSPLVNILGLTEESKSIILGLEANKIVSEVSLFNPPSINSQRLSLLRDSIAKLCNGFGINFDKGLAIYAEAYSRLLYLRKGIFIPMELLVDRFPALRFLSDNGESLKIDRY